MTNGATFLAIDWGTTNRRIHGIDAKGAVLASTQDDRGVLTIGRADFPNEIAAIRNRMGELPVLCAGMVGSNRGWIEVPYAPCPADISALARNIYWIEPGRTAIVAGLATIVDGRGDVMRGEEVQILGAAAAGLIPPNAVVCQPGTHCKWARVSGGAVMSIRTCMTGELFALLRGHSVIGDAITGDVVVGPAFLEGVADARRGQLLSDLFGVRASALLRLRSPEDGPSYASGLLIGSDVREQNLEPGQTIYLIADAVLGALYSAALAAAGVRVVPIDSAVCFVAGMTNLWGLVNDRR